MDYKKVLNSNQKDLAYFGTEIDPAKPWDVLKRNTTTQISNINK